MAAIREIEKLKRETEKCWSTNVHEAKRTKRVRGQKKYTRQRRLRTFRLSYCRTYRNGRPAVSCGAANLESQLLGRSNESSRPASKASVGAHKNSLKKPLVERIKFCPLSRSKMLKIARTFGSCKLNKFSYLAEYLVLKRTTFSIFSCLTVF